MAHDQVSLSWDDPGDDTITGYQVLRRNKAVDDPGVFHVHVENTGSAATSYVDSDVEAETRYVYRIKASNATGLSPQSSYFNADTPATPPPPEPESQDPPAQPTGLTSAVTHDSVTLRWDNPDDSSITGYQILRRDRAVHGEGKFIVVDDDTESAGQSYVDSDVEAETRYVYRIKARNAAGLSPRSGYFNADTPAAPPPPEPENQDPPAQPTGLTSAVTHDMVTLSWDDPQDDFITGYRVLRLNRAEDDLGEFHIHVSSTGSAATSYLDSDVEPETRYVYRIRALNAQGESPRSGYTDADTPAAPEAPAPAAPANLFTAATHDQVLLNWEDPGDDSITGYRILRGPDTGSLTTLVEDTGSASTSYTDDSVEPETTYVYALRARNSSGESGRSETARVTTTAAPDELTTARASHDVCARTDEVEAAIVAAVSGVTACGDVTETHLDGITSLDISGSGIDSLSNGDFGGLTALTILDLSDNDLTTLPEDVFDGLSALLALRLYDNDLTGLPEDVFDGLTALQLIQLHRNDLTELPEDVFDGLTALTLLWLDANDLTKLPEDVFDGLTALTELRLSANDLTVLPEDVFDGLTALTTLWLDANDLTELPEDVFDGPTALTTLWLFSNQIAELPAGVFDGLTALTELRLDANDLTGLPEDVFDGLTALTHLYLGENELTELPEDVFDGLTALTDLLFATNDLDILPDGLFEDLVALIQLNFDDNPGEPFTPVANAGNDQVVGLGAEVTLDGSATAAGNPWGSNITYAWTQTGGEDVTLTGEDTAQPTFTAPDEVGELTFELTVTGAGRDAEANPYTATAQTSVLIELALVSNTGESQDASNAVGIFAMVEYDIATSFHTGDSPGGYLLTSVQLLINRNREATPEVSIFSDSSGNVGTSLYTLTNPSPLPLHTDATTFELTTFTAPARTSLAADTTYWLVAKAVDPSNNVYYDAKLTDSDNESSDDSTEWNIGDVTHRSQDNAAWSQSSVRSIQMNILGKLILPGLVTVSPSRPRAAGVQLTATLTDPYGGVTNLSWTWERSADGVSSWQTIGANSDTYTTVTADIDQYLRATASYDNDLLTGRTASGRTNPNNYILLHTDNDNPAAVVSDGTHFWIGDLTDLKFYAYTLSGERVPPKDVDGVTTQFTFGAWTDGQRLYLVDSDKEMVFAYPIGGDERDQTYAFEFGLLVQSGMWSDGTTIWILEREVRTLLAFKLSTGAQDAAKDVFLEGYYDVVPGDIADAGNVFFLTSDGTTYWIQGDNKIWGYRYDGRRVLGKDVNGGGGPDTRRGLEYADGVLWTLYSTDLTKLYAHSIPDVPGEVTISPSRPRSADIELTASLHNQNGGWTNLSWQWERSADGNSGWQTIGADSDTYTTVAADVGQYLRATATYDDDYQTGRTAAGLIDPNNNNILLHAANRNAYVSASDGAHVWVVDAENRIQVGDERIYAYTVSGERAPAKDLTGLTLEVESGMWTDGVTLYVLNGASRKIIAFPVGGNAPDTSKGFTLPQKAYSGIWSDGETIWVFAPKEQKLYAYTLATRTRAESRDIALKGIPDDAADAVFLASDGKTIWTIIGGVIWAFDFDGNRVPSKDIAFHDDNAQRRGLTYGDDLLWVTDDYDRTLYAYRIPDTPGEIAFDGAVAQVDEPITASVLDYDGDVTNARWQWSISDSPSSEATPISGANAASYTPVQAQLGKYLHVVADYDDGNGPGKRAESVPVWVYDLRIDLTLDPGMFAYEFHATDYKPLGRFRFQWKSPSVTPWPTHDQFRPTHDQSNFCAMPGITRPGAMECGWESVSPGQGVSSQLAGLVLNDANREYDFRIVGELREGGELFSNTIRMLVVPDPTLSSSTERGIKAWRVDSAGHFIVEWHLAQSCPANKQFYIRVDTSSEFACRTPGRDRHGRMLFANPPTMDTDISAAEVYIYCATGQTDDNRGHIYATADIAAKGTDPVLGAEQTR